ncbi:glycosyltransferase [Vibrio sp. 1159]|uniref:glycosyltransferase n=1 Tax=Vibrio sp. 1159 TaxID=3074545 RepID=UPI002964B52E|nr:glycosyltransferase [Vibrio sp. 1159]MDW2323630.1 glycosyltransferase [Vibrio sp. 1159]
MAMLEKLARKAKRSLTYQKDPNLDLAFYRSSNPDLKGFSDNQLYEHWYHYGKNEGRLGRAGTSQQTETLSLDFELNLSFYLSYYSDLQAAGIETLEQAKIHWLRYGSEEGRYRTAKEWMEKNNFYQFSDPSTYDYDYILDANSELNVTSRDLLDLSIGKIVKPIRLYEEECENSSFYKHLGINCYNYYKSTGDQNALDSARTAWRVSLYFVKTSEVTEFMANSYFDMGDYRTAQKTYESALDLCTAFNVHLTQNLVKCYEKLHKHRKSVELLVEQKERYPDVTILDEWLDDAVEKLSWDFAGGIQILSTLDEKQMLVKRVQEFSSIAYDAYYRLFTQAATNDVALKTNLNTEKVLIVGDFHVKQCIRYRIDQKVEQLESQGKVVTTVDWMYLSENQNLIALHDVVIFYRVPAEPEVLKAMAKVNANGKASFYEIDDLLFDESYPAPLESYGGGISLNTFIELKKSMAVFKAAAQFCRFGIASTNLLCEKLAPLVQSGQCLLHRNGLDKLNEFRVTDKSNKETIDIFYGSGTLAHNSDFIEQALPALETILSKYRQTRLVIAGHLQLPATFVQKYSKQLRRIPAVNSVKAYWTLLEQADINLAVLVDDEINGCKSELKWFEAACFGIPSVVSTTANYRDVIKDGEDGFIAATKADWVSALQTLIEQPKVRAQVAHAAMKRIKQEYSVEALGSRLVTELDNTLSPVKTRKKIALVNVFFPPQAIGGATRVLSDNFDVLQQKYGDDFELVVFTSDERCTTPYQLSVYQHQGVTVYRSSILYRENMDWHSQDPEMYTLFEQFLQLEQPDLVHFHCVQRLTASVVEATKDKAIPYIVTAHDAWWISDHQFLVDGQGKVYPEGHPDIFEPRNLPNNVTLGDSIERIMYFRELLNGADKLLTVSEGFANIYRKNGFPQTQVNKNGISATVQWLPKQTDYTSKVVCAHIGSMATHKGYFLLKEVIEHEQPANIEMLIVDHSKPEGYQQTQFWGKVPVRFIGRISQAGITRLYQQMDVLFAPSLWPESFGLVTREAAASGCWVVASELGGMGEDVLEGKTGLRVKPDFTHVSKAVKEIDRNAKKYKQKINQPDIRLADKQVDELVEIYK